MPHPEHAVDPVLGGTDGVPVLRAFLGACVRGEQA
jgi:phosphoribosylformylglycinamidine (FGAM) synthase-like amidotransferase family enzyme